MLSAIVNIVASAVVAIVLTMAFTLVKRSISGFLQLCMLSTFPTESDADDIATAPPIAVLLAELQARRSSPPRRARLRAEPLIR